MTSWRSCRACNAEPCTERHAAGGTDSALLLRRMNHCSKWSEISSQQCRHGDASEDGMRVRSTIEPKHASRRSRWAAGCDTWGKAAGGSLALAENTVLNANHITGYFTSVRSQQEAAGGEMHL